MRQYTEILGFCPYFAKKKKKKEEEIICPCFQTIWVYVPVLVLNYPKASFYMKLNYTTIGLLKVQIVYNTL